MDAPRGFWGALENSSKMHHPSDHKFITALVVALKLCKSNTRPEIKLEALEGVKAMALEMNPGRFDYAIWLELRVVMTVRDHPSLIDNLSPDDLRLAFGFPFFESNGLNPAKSQTHAFSAQHYPSPSPDTGRSATSSRSPRDESPGFHGFENMQRAIANNIRYAMQAQYANAPAQGQFSMQTYSGYVPSQNFATLNSLAAPIPAPAPASFRSGSNFQPSHECLGIRHAPSKEALQLAAAVGMRLNPNYRGDLMPLDIDNSMCPPEQNCAIRIENIAATATEKEIFATFTEGRVFSFSKKDPIPGRFKNCAARLVFTTRAAAEAFHRKGNSWPGIWLRGHRFFVKWNRDPCRPVSDSERHQTRVIRVMGPKDLLHAQDLENLFHTQIKFKLVDRSEWLVADEKRVVELSFCSILGQSRIAYKFFHEFMETCDLTGLFTICFGRDPCEPSVPTIGYPLPPVQGFS